MDHNITRNENESQVSFVAQTVALSVINILAVVGNFLLSYTLYRRQFLLTPSNKLVLSLTCSNLVFLILVLPFVVTSTVLQRWPLGNLWCSVSGFFTLTILSSSMFTLSAISYDRYYAVVYPLMYPSKITGYRSTVITVLSWLVSALSALPPLFGSWSSYKFSVDKLGCFPVWSTHRGFSLFWLILCCLLPFCVMITCYTCMCYVAHKKASKIDVGTKLNDSKLKVNNANKEMGAKLKPTAYCKVHRPVQGVHALSDGLVDIAEDSGIDTSFRTKDVENPQLPHQVEHDLNQCTLLHSNRSDEILISDKTQVNNLNKNNHHCVSGHPLSSSASVVHRKEESAECAPSTSSTSSSHQLFSSNKPEQLFHTDPVVMRKSIQMKRSSSCGPAPSKRPQHVWRRSTDSSLTSTPDRVGSSLSHRVSASPRKSLTFNYTHYYANHRKASCTIFMVVGFLFFTVGPFFITSVVETFLPTTAVNSTLSYSMQPRQEHLSPIPRWWLSVASCLLYLSCLHYPIIYGAWNRTVRDEMKSLILGTARGPQTKRTRILSLSTHIKDLGLSPRLTAAIMVESAAVATIVRPMQILRSCAKKQNSFKMRLKSTCRKWSINRGSIEDADCLTFQNRNNSPSVLENNNNKLLNSNENNNTNQFREREQPDSHPLQLNSSQVMESDVLSSLMVFSPPSLGAGVMYNGGDSNPPFTKMKSLLSEEVDAEPATSERTSTYVSDDDAATINLSSDEDGNHDLQVSLASRNLVHLKPAEPIKIRRWKKLQMVDYFAQTMAYDLVEMMRT